MKRSQSTGSDEDVVNLDTSVVEDVFTGEEGTPGKKRRRSRRSKKQRVKKKLLSTKDRVRNLAAAAAVLRAQQKEAREKEAELASKKSNKALTAEQKSAAMAHRNLQRCQALSRPIPVPQVR